jgi:hypothetical protein
MPTRKIGKTMGDSTGPGSPAHLMEWRVKTLLARMRNTIGFPVPIVDFLKTVYPREIFEPVQNREAAPWDNLLTTVNLGKYAHFSIEGHTDNETFWVCHPEGDELPAPADVSVTLTFSRHNPYFDTVNVWVAKALELHVDLAQMHDSARGFIMRAKHPVHVARYWPELHAFVAAAVPELAARSLALEAPSNTLALPGKRARDEITDALAKCSLLPEVECQAWVQFPEGE